MKEHPYLAKSCRMKKSLNDWQIVQKNLRQKGRRKCWIFYQNTFFQLAQQTELQVAVVVASPIFRSLHRLTITERIECKLLSLTYKVLTTTQPSYLHNLITVQPPRSTRSSSLVTFARPSTSSFLRITDRSFQYASPSFWNQLPASLRQLHTNLSNSDSPSSLTGTSSIGPSDSPLSSSITPSLFHSRLKTFFSANPSHRTPPFLLQDWLHVFPGLFTDTSEHTRFFTFYLFLFSTVQFLVPCGRLSWRVSAFESTLK